MPTLSKSSVSLIILAAISAVVLGLVVFDELTGKAISSTLQTLLGVVLGFLGQNLASAQGAEQAASLPQTPPPTTPGQTP